MCKSKLCPPNVDSMSLYFVTHTVSECLLKSFTRLGHRTDSECKESKKVTVHQLLHFSVAQSCLLLLIRVRYINDDCEQRIQMMSRKYKGEAITNFFNQNVAQLSSVCCNDLFINPLSH